VTESSLVSSHQLQVVDIWINYNILFWFYIVPFILIIVCFGFVLSQTYLALIKFIENILH
jgi:hypothetical protein